MSWVDISLLEVIQSFESSAHSDVDALGFKPWSSHLPVTLPNEKVDAYEIVLLNSFLIGTTIFDV